MIHIQAETLQNRCQHVGDVVKCALRSLNKQEDDLKTIFHLIKKFNLSDVNIPMESAMIIDVH